VSDKAKELDNRHQGDRGACPICNLRPERVSESRLWAWAMRQRGPVKPLRGSTRT
jgi:hypothetical protein